MAAWWRLALTAKRIAHAEALRHQMLLEVEDLTQEAVVGLYRAAQRWDPSRGVSFDHVAGWWVRASIQRAQEVTGRLVRLPGGVNLGLARARQIERSAQRQGVDLSQAEIAAAVGLPEERLVAAQAAGAACASLDGPVDEEGGARLGDLVLHESWEAEADIDSRRETARFERALSRLPERLQIVARRRLEGDRLVDVGAQLGLSRERVRQLEAEARALLLADLRGDP